MRPRLGLKVLKRAAARRNEQRQAGDGVVVRGLGLAIHLLKEAGGQPVASILQAAGGVGEGRQRAAAECSGGISRTVRDMQQAMLQKPSRENARQD